LSDVRVEIVAAGNDDAAVYYLLCLCASWQCARVDDVYAVVVSMCVHVA